jgi:hypothetical protein
MFVTYFPLPVLNECWYDAMWRQLCWMGKVLQRKQELRQFRNDGVLCFPWMNCYSNDLLLRVWIAYTSVRVSTNDLYKVLSNYLPQHKKIENKVNFTHIHTYTPLTLYPEGVAEASQVCSETLTFYLNYLTVRNTADVTSGKPIAVESQFILGVSTPKITR